MHQLGAAGSSRSLDASAAPVPPPPAKNAASPVSGAWLLRDLPNQKPPINLLTREEAQQAQRQLIERGYLLGPADGTGAFARRRRFWISGVHKDFRLTRPGQAKSRAHLPRNPHPPRNCQLKELVGSNKYFLPIGPPTCPMEWPDRSRTISLTRSRTLRRHRGHPARHSQSALESPTSEHGRDRAQPASKARCHRSQSQRSGLPPSGASPANASLNRFAGRVTAGVRARDASPMGKRGPPTCTSGQPPQL